MATLGDDTLTATTRTRVNFSVLGLLAAAQFSRSVGEREAKHRGQEFGPFFEEIMAEASACVLLSAASLEAYANELFADRSKLFQNLPNSVLDQIWEDTERKSTLCKFSTILRLLDKPVLNKGAAPYQDVKLLVALRNALMHFKPEWHDEKDAHAKLSRRLEERMTLSSFLPSTETGFPRRWACHACSRWAVQTCISFADDFSAKAGVKSKYVASPAYAAKLEP